MKNTIVALAALIGVAGATFFVTDYLHKQELEQVVEAQNEQARQFGVVINELTGTAEARAQQVIGQQDIIEELRNANQDLAVQLERADAEILSLQHTNADLRESFSGEAEGEAEGEEVRVAVSDTIRYDGPSYLSLTGTLFLNTSTLLTRYNFDVSGELHVGTTVSRLPTNELRVDVWSDAPLTFKTIEVTNNLDDPIHDRTRGGFFDGLVEPSSTVPAVLGFLLGMAVK